MPDEDTPDEVSAPPDEDSSPAETSGSTQTVARRPAGGDPLAYLFTGKPSPGQRRKTNTGDPLAALLDQAGQDHPNDALADRLEYVPTTGEKIARRLLGGKWAAETVGKFGQGVIEAVEGGVQTVRSMNQKQAEYFDKYGLTMSDDQSFQTQVPEEERGPSQVEANKADDKKLAEIGDWLFHTGEKVGGTMLGQDPATKETFGGKVAGAVGSTAGLIAASANPYGMLTGAGYAALGAKSTTYHQSKDQFLEKYKKEGMSDEAAGEKAEQDAQDYSNAMAAATVPEMMAFMGAGKIASNVVTKLAADSPAWKQFLASSVAAYFANAASGTGGAHVKEALIHDPVFGRDPNKPLYSTEQFIQDALFALMHAKHATGEMQANKARQEYVTKFDDRMRQMAEDTEQERLAKAYGDGGPDEGAAPPQGGPPPLPIRPATPGEIKAADDKATDLENKGAPATAAAVRQQAAKPKVTIPEARHIGPDENTPLELEQAVKNGTMTVADVPEEFGGGRLFMPVEEAPAPTNAKGVEQTKPATRSDVDQIEMEAQHYEEFSQNMDDHTPEQVKQYRKDAQAAYEHAQSLDHSGLPEEEWQHFEDHKQILRDAILEMDKHLKDHADEKAAATQTNEPAKNTAGKATTPPPLPKARPVDQGAVEGSGSPAGRTDQTQGTTAVSSPDEALTKVDTAARRMLGTFDIDADVLNDPSMHITEVAPQPDGSYHVTVEQHNGDQVERHVVAVKQGGKVSEGQPIKSEPVGTMAKPIFRNAKGEPVEPMTPEERRRAERLAEDRIDEGASGPDANEDAMGPIAAQKRQLEMLQKRHQELRGLLHDETDPMERLRIQHEQHEIEMKLRELAVGVREKNPLLEGLTINLDSTDIPPPRQPPKPNANPIESPVAETQGEQPRPVQEVAGGSPAPVQEAPAAPEKPQEVAQTDATKFATGPRAVVEQHNKLLRDGQFPEAQQLEERTRNMGRGGLADHLENTRGRAEKQAGYVAPEAEPTGEANPGNVDPKEAVAARDHLESFYKRQWANSLTETQIQNAVDNAFAYALRKFDPSKGASFKTSMENILKLRLIDEYRKAGGQLGPNGERLTRFVTADDETGQISVNDETAMRQQMDARQAEEFDRTARENSQLNETLDAFRASLSPADQRLFDYYWAKRTTGKGSTAGNPDKLFGAGALDKMHAKFEQLIEDYKHDPDETLASLRSSRPVQGGGGPKQTGADSGGAPASDRPQGVPAQNAAGGEQGAVQPAGTRSPEPVQPTGAQAAIPATPAAIRGRLLSRILDAPEGKYGADGPDLLKQAKAAKTPDELQALSDRLDTYEGTGNREVVPGPDVAAERPASTAGREGGTTGTDLGRAQQGPDTAGEVGPEHPSVGEAGVLGPAGPVEPSWVDKLKAELAAKKQAEAATTPEQESIKKSLSKIEETVNKDIATQGQTEAPAPVDQGPEPVLTEGVPFEQRVQRRQKLEARAMGKAADGRSWGDVAKRALVKRKMFTQEEMDNEGVAFAMQKMDDIQPDWQQKYNELHAPKPEAATTERPATVAEALNPEEAPKKTWVQELAEKAQADRLAREKQVLPETKAEQHEVALDDAKKGTPEAQAAAAVEPSPVAEVAEPEPPPLAGPAPSWIDELKAQVAAAKGQPAAEPVVVEASKPLTMADLPAREGPAPMLPENQAIIDGARRDLAKGNITQEEYDRTISNITADNEKEYDAKRLAEAEKKRIKSENDKAKRAEKKSQIPADASTISAVEKIKRDAASPEDAHKRAKEAGIPTPEADEAAKTGDADKLAVALANDLAEAVKPKTKVEAPASAEVDKKIDAIAEAKPEPARVQEPQAAKENEQQGLPPEAGATKKAGDPKKVGRRLIITDADKVPTPPDYVEAGKYNLFEEQRFSINSMLHAIKRGLRGYLDADGVGVGKGRIAMGLAIEAHELEKAKAAAEGRPVKKVLVLTASDKLVQKYIHDLAAMSDQFALTQLHKMPLEIAVHMLDRHGIVLAKYPDLRRGVRTMDGKMLNEDQYHTVIADEAHSLKNSDSQTAQAFADLKRDFTAHLTATPFDRVINAEYFLPDVTGERIDMIRKKLGYYMKTEYDRDGNPTKKVATPIGNKTWEQIAQHVVELRGEMVANGQAIRRAYPFYGDIKKVSHIESLSDTPEHEAFDMYYADAPFNARGNLIQQLARWTEWKKIDHIEQLIHESIAKGEKPVVFSETVNDPKPMQWLQGHEQPKGLLTELTRRLEAKGLKVAKIYGGNDKKVGPEVAKFQSGKADVALASKQNGVGIDLDDQVGNAPRHLILASPLYEGNTYDQILGRVSRANTKSESRVSVLMSDSGSDLRREATMEHKLEVLHAIQGGKDIDLASFEEGKEKLKAGAFGHAGERGPAPSKVQVFRNTLAFMEKQANATKDPAIKGNLVDLIAMYKQKINRAVGTSGMQAGTMGHAGENPIATTEPAENIGHEVEPIPGGSMTRLDPNNPAHVERYAKALAEGDSSVVMKGFGDQLFDRLKRVASAMRVGGSTPKEVSAYLDKLPDRLTERQVRPIVEAYVNHAERVARAMGRGSLEPERDIKGAAQIGIENTGFRLGSNIDAMVKDFMKWGDVEQVRQKISDAMDEEITHAIDAKMRYERWVRAGKPDGEHGPGSGYFDFAMKEAHDRVDDYNRDISRLPTADRLLAEKAMLKAYNSYQNSSNFHNYSNDKNVTRIKDGVAFAKEVNDKYGGDPFHPDMPKHIFTDHHQLMKFLAESPASQRMLGSEFVRELDQARRMGHITENGYLQGIKAWVQPIIDWMKGFLQVANHAEYYSPSMARRLNEMEVIRKHLDAALQGKRVLGRDFAEYMKMSNELRTLHEQAPTDFDMKAEAMAAHNPAAQGPAAPTPQKPVPKRDFTAEEKLTQEMDKVAGTSRPEIPDLPRPDLGKGGVPLDAQKIKEAVGAAVPKLNDWGKLKLWLSGEQQMAKARNRSMVESVLEAIPERHDRVVANLWADHGGDTKLLTKARDEAAARGDRDRAAQYQDALNIRPDLQTKAEAIRKYYDMVGAEGIKEGWFKDFKENYVHRVTDHPISSMLGIRKGMGRMGAEMGLGRRPSFTRAREFDTISELEAKGYKLRSDDIAENLAAYADAFSQYHTQTKLIKAMRAARASDNKPLLSFANRAPERLPSKATPKEKERYERADRSGYKKLEGVPTATPLYFHPHVAREMKNLFSGSAYSKWLRDINPETHMGERAVKAGLIGLDKATRAIKRGMFGGPNPFHMMTVGSRVLGTVNPFTMAGAAKGRKLGEVLQDIVSGKGIEPFDPSNPEHADAVAHGLKLHGGDYKSTELFHEGVLANNKDLAQKFVTGLSKMASKLPGIEGSKLEPAIRGAGDTVSNLWGSVGKFTFDTYIPALKLETYQKNLQLNLKHNVEDLRSGKVTVQEIKAMTSDQVNNMFGDLNETVLARNPTVQHVLRSTILAPDFLWSTLKYMGQAGLGAGNLVANAARGKFDGGAHYTQIRSLAAATMLYALTTQIFDTLADGKPHLDDPLAFHYKNRRYSIRSVLGDAIHAVSDPFKFAAGRESPALKYAATATAGRNYRGEKISQGQAFQEALMGGLPIMFRGLTTQLTKDIPGIGQYLSTETDRTNPTTPAEQTLGAMGFHIKRTSPVFDAYALAKNYKTSQGIKEDTGVYPVSKYQPLRYALEDGNSERAEAVMKKIMEDPKAKAGLVKGFTQSVDHPYTGSKPMDLAMRQAATPEQKQILKQADATRAKMKQDFFELYKKLSKK